MQCVHVCCLASASPALIMTVQHAPATAQRCTILHCNKPLCTPLCSIARCAPLHSTAQLSTAVHCTQASCQHCIHCARHMHVAHAASFALLAHVLRPSRPHSIPQSTIPEQVSCATKGLLGHDRSCCTVTCCHSNHQPHAANRQRLATKTKTRQRTVRQGRSNAPKQLLDCDAAAAG